MSYKNQQTYNTQTYTCRDSYQKTQSAMQQTTARQAQSPGSIVRTSHEEHSKTIVTQPATTTFDQRQSNAQLTTGQISAQHVGQSQIATSLSPVNTSVRRSTGRVSTRELDTRVSTIVGEKVLVSRESRKSVVKGYNYGESKLVAEKHLEGGIISVTESRGEAVVRQHLSPQARRYISNEVHLEEEEEIVTVERIVEKPVEVTVQRKIAVERIVEVPYDVIVDKPVEKIFHKEVITEKFMEKPVEKVVEIPVEVVYEIPVEKIIERHIEYETVVEVPVEKLVEKRVNEYIEQVRYNDHFQEVNANDLARYQGYDILPTEVRTVIRDKIIDRPIYIDNVIERIVEHKYDNVIEKLVDKVIEIPVERIIEKPVYVDNFIQRTYDVPVQRIVEKPVEQIVERKVFYDNIIEKPVPVERVVVRTVDVPVERIVDVPVYVDNIIERPYEVIREVEVPYEQIIQHPIETKMDHIIGITEFHGDTYEKVYERAVKVNQTHNVNIEFVIDKDIYVPRENTIQVQRQQIIPKFVERDVMKNVTCEKITERLCPVEQIVEIPVVRRVEVPRFVEQVIEKQVQIEKTIERLIERIVENRVEVSVEKIIEVPMNIHTERAICKQNLREEQINIDAKVLQAVEGSHREQTIEINDQSLEADITRNQNEQFRMQQENTRLASELQSLRSSLAGFKMNGCSKEEAEVLQMRSRITELQSRHSVIEQDTDRLVKKSLRSSMTSVTHVEVLVEHPDVQKYRVELTGLIGENRRLVEQVKRMGRVVAL